MDKTLIEQKAKLLREQIGGTVLAFPIEEENPFSKYAVVMYVANKYFVYPEASDISTAAVGVATILEQLRKNGHDSNYERNVRFVSYQSQMDAPSVTMRRLKKNNSIT